MASEENNNSQEDTVDEVIELDSPELESAEVKEQEASLESDDSVSEGADEVEDAVTSEGADIEVDFGKLKKIVEGAIFAAAKPMTIDHLANLFAEEVRPTNDEFRAVLESLMTDYADRGVMLKQVSSGYRFQAVEEVASWVSRLWEEKPARYSRALLETLALIAYRQPITRGEIEEIRGVSTSSHIMKTLQEREWIRVVGHRDVPGRPAMYATTRNFLDYFNLKNIDELPSLSEIRDLDEINRELDLAAGIEPSQEPSTEQGEASASSDPDDVPPQESTLELEDPSAPQGDGQEIEGAEPAEAKVAAELEDEEVPNPEADKDPESGANDQETEAETR